MLDLSLLERLVARHGRVARVVIVDIKGSTPRETGTAMVVWDGGSTGTIGGGRLEWEATALARDMLGGGARTRLTRHALGPHLNQCCGGAVTLVTEVFDAARLAQVLRDVGAAQTYARPVAPGEETLPAVLARRIARAQQSSVPLRPTYLKGWLAEPVWQPRRPVFIYGAGHVGRALAGVLAQLPDLAVTVADPRAECIAALPAGVAAIGDRAQAAVMLEAPDDAIHFIMTPAHDVDLELCHTLLGRPFGFAGLIGSRTKWARFRKRLAALGHGADAIARITCPIGDPALGKHPQAIAIGVAAALLRTAAPGAAREERRA